VIRDAAQPYGAKIEADFRSGVDSGVRGTPTLFINGHRYAGRVDLPPANDIRSTIPWFAPDALRHTEALVDLLRRIADGLGATPGQIALAWLLAQKPWIVPIPGTRRPSRLEENIGAAEVILTAAGDAEITAAADAITIEGGRYAEAAERMTDL
jgi:aryl-alcohol dehydrogenase-like predicted oxidoreductase